MHTTLTTTYSVETDTIVAPPDLDIDFGPSPFSTPGIEQTLSFTITATSEDGYEDAIEKIEFIRDRLNDAVTDLRAAQLAAEDSPSV